MLMKVNKLIDFCTHARAKSCTRLSKLQNHIPKQNRAFMFKCSQNVLQALLF